MDHILRHLPPGSRVLDLAAQYGSFRAGRYLLTTIRVDLEPTPPATGETAIRADAAQLPFQNRSFDAVICNHGLEHFVRLEDAVREMGRVIAPGGALFVTVPDARTLTDRLYRFLARGGGHVNPFRSPDEVRRLLEQRTGFPFRSRRTLFTSLSFIHPANRGPRRNRRLVILLGAGERALRWGTWLCRHIDLLLGTRLSIYGWALYFGRVPDGVPTTGWSNTCVRCGAGHPSETLRPTGWPRAYRCPACQTLNLFTEDESFAGVE